MLIGIETILECGCAIMDFKVYQIQKDQSFKEIEDCIQINTETGIGILEKYDKSSHRLYKIREKDLILKCKHGIVK